MGRGRSGAALLVHMVRQLLQAGAGPPPPRRRGAAQVGSSGRRPPPGGCSPPVLPGRLGSQWETRVRGWGRLLWAGTEPPLSEASAFDQASPLPVGWRVLLSAPSSPFLQEAHRVARCLVGERAGLLVPLAFGGWGGAGDKLPHSPCAHPPLVARGDPGLRILPWLSRLSHRPGLPAQLRGRVGTSLSLHLVG